MQKNLLYLSWPAAMFGNHRKKPLSAHRSKLASLLEKQPHLHVPQIVSFLVLMLYKILEYQCHLKHEKQKIMVHLLISWLSFFMFSKSKTDDNNNNNNNNNDDDDDDDDDITTKLICVTVNISTYTYILTYIHNGAHIKESPLLWTC